MQKTLLLLLFLLEGITSARDAHKSSDHGPPWQQSQNSHPHGPYHPKTDHQDSRNHPKPDHENSNLKESPDGRKECKIRDYGNDSRVCVCDSSHCDTIPRPTRVDHPKFIIYTSNKKGLRFRKSIGEFKRFQHLNRNNSIRIDPTKSYQKVYGFGGAFTDSTGINILTLKEEARDLLMESYFSENGIEYNLCRVPISGTDFSTRFYTYDDTEDPDPELKHFALQQEDFDYKIPLIKQAAEIRGDDPFRLFASNWGAPLWMKTNDQFYGNGFIKKEYFQVWAEYFVKFLEAYKDNGIDFWGITTQNEPTLAILGLANISTVGWTSINLTIWVRDNLGPTIKKSNFPDTTIIILDDQKLLLPWYTNSVLGDKQVRQFVSGIGIHWYYGILTPCVAMSRTHTNFPNIFILSTEACSGFQHSDGVKLGSWERGEDYTTDIIENMNCWVVGWVDWNMVLDLQGGPNVIRNFVDSPIVVNASSGEFYKQPMYYHLGHHSKFVPVDSVRIEWSGTLDENVRTVAYQTPDRGIVVVILNKDDEDVQVRLSHEGVGTAALKISRRSINTILYWPD